MTAFRVFLAQLAILWRDPAGNLERLRGLMQNLPGDEQTLLVLPEMMSTGFTDELEALAEPAQGSWEQAFQALVTATSLPVLLGIARRQPDGITNEAVLFRPEEGESGVSYRKIRRFKGENKVVTGGRTVVTFDFHGVTICPLICYDLRFPEIFRAGLRQGAEIFIVMANWPDIRHQHWELLLQARAIENQAFVVGVNRCGDDPALHYAGGSMVVDPHGKILYHAGDAEAIDEVLLDIEEMRAWRSAFPAVSDYLGEPGLP